MEPLYPLAAAIEVELEEVKRAAAGACYGLGSGDGPAEVRWWWSATAIRLWSNANVPPEIVAEAKRIAADAALKNQTQGELTTAEK